MAGPAPDPLLWVAVCEGAGDEAAAEAVGSKAAATFPPLEERRSVDPGRGQVVANLFGEVINADGPVVLVDEDEVLRPRLGSVLFLPPSKRIPDPRAERPGLAGDVVLRLVLPQVDDALLDGKVEIAPAERHRFLAAHALAVHEAEQDSEAERHLFLRRCQELRVLDGSQDGEDHPRVRLREPSLGDRRRGDEAQRVDGESEHAVDDLCVLPARAAGEGLTVAF
ncbi:MAG TPA: hypothetical protein VK550_34755 [Polyangiaceae bacterium]|nr:hypothetical protein [Polyangiaceae bacterium]